MYACLSVCLSFCLSMLVLYVCCCVFVALMTHTFFSSLPFQFDFRLSARNVEYGFSISVFQWNWICSQLFLMVIVVSAVCCRPNHLVSKKNANRSISIHFINIVKCRKFTNCIKCTLLLSIPMWMCLPVFMCSPLCLLFCVTYFVSIFLKSSHFCTLFPSNSNWR